MYIFKNEISSIELRQLPAGACLVEVKIEGEGDVFSFRDKGIITLGHHPLHPALVDEIATRTTCEQALALVSARPDWEPTQIIRPIRPVNMDDVLACLIVDPETREIVLSSSLLPRLIFEISVTDLRGPSGYGFLEKLSHGKLLLNAIYNKFEPDPARAGRMTDEELKEKFFAMREYIYESCRSDSLEPEEVQMVPADYEVLRENGTTVMVFGRKGWCFDELYRKGYVRVIVLGENPDGTTRCTIGQASPLYLKNGLLVPTPPIPFDKLAEIEPGWGGRATIGGSPRKGGTKLSPEEIWEIAKL